MWCKVKREAVKAVVQYNQLDEWLDSKLGQKKELSQGSEGWSCNVLKRDRAEDRRRPLRGG